MNARVKQLDKLLQKQIKNKQIFNIVLSIQSGDNSFEWAGAAGIANPSLNTQMRVDSPYFIASITKIFTASAIMLLHEQKRLSLEDPITRFFAPNQIDRLHYFKGRDYTNQLKVYHLVNQTSGLADYFEQKNKKGQSLLDTMLEEGDAEWDVEQVLDLVKNDLKPKFAPASKQRGKHKAFYSDTNYQLLGAILEKVLEKSLGQIFHDFFFAPLDLPNTYLFGDDVAVEREEPATIYANKKALTMPKAMHSFGADGGVVSTSKEQIKLLQALFGGKLFKEAQTLDWMMQWNKIFFPLEYGYGLMRYKLPWFFSPFSPLPEFIGHSGASGAFAFYCPKQDLYLSGTINQLEARSMPFKLILKLVNIVK